MMMYKTRSLIKETFEKQLTYKTGAPIPDSRFKKAFEEVRRAERDLVVYRFITIVLSCIIFCLLLKN